MSGIGAGLEMTLKAGKFLNKWRKKRKLKKALKRAGVSAANNPNMEIITMDTKPGYQTTEFWIATLGSLVAALNQSGALGEYQLPAETIMTIGGVIVAYILGRSFVKG